MTTKSRKTYEKFEKQCDKMGEDIMNSPKRVIKANSYAGKGIAVFTSGGDSQGM